MPRQPYSCIVLKTYSDKSLLGCVLLSVWLAVVDRNPRSIKQFATADAEYGAHQE